MTDTLNDKKIKRLGELGQAIQNSLSRTDRIDAVKHMQEYLEIHGYTVNSNRQLFCTNGMISDEEARPFDLVNGRDCDGTPYN